MIADLDELMGTAPVKGAKVECPPPGIYPDIPAYAYHALPYISSSFLKKFKTCPASALLPVEQTPSMILGSASHAYSLEGEVAFLDDFAVIPEIAPPADFKGQRWTATNEYKAKVATFQASAKNKTLLTRDQFDVVLGLHRSLQAHPLASALLRQGGQELTLIWDDPKTGLRCKARIDHNPGKNVLVDYKTISDPAKFISQAVSLNYDIQGAWYSIGAEANDIQVDTFVFVAGGTSEPHPVRCGFMVPDWIEWAKGECSRLMGLVKECYERDHFPAYTIPAYITSLSQLQPADLLEQWDMPKWR